MKRSPLKRKSPMKRTRSRPGKSKTKYARRERDWAYMAFVRGEPCALSGGAPVACDLWVAGHSPDGCRGQIEAHHAGVHGVGQKADDNTCVSLCQYHHRCLTDRTKAFSGWPRGAIKTWELAAVAHYSARYSENLDSDGESPF